MEFGISLIPKFSLMYVKMCVMGILKLPLPPNSRFYFVGYNTSSMLMYEKIKSDVGPHYV